MDISGRYGLGTLIFFALGMLFIALNFYAMALGIGLTHVHPWP
ncbi:MAG TPA: hypothetical protein VFI42_12325 [Thermomicrobiaceae bacterium]|nr:hypothetical protein [Thermomicrobiaceae bacterium]HEU5424200.1 hypothetical protein [Nitrolancea sp.]